MRSKKIVRRVAGACLAVVSLAACGAEGGKATGVRAVSAGIVKGDGIALPAPQGEPILVVRGAGLRANTAEGVALDLASLDALPTVEVTVDDPWEKREILYRGVLTSELLAAVGAPAAASEVKFTALDAYEVTLSAEELRSGAVLLVTRADGQLLPVKEGGPTKIAFLPSTKVGKNKDLWIWSIKEMVVQ